MGFSKIDFILATAFYPWSFPSFKVISKFLDSSFPERVHMQICKEEEAIAAVAVTDLRVWKHACLHINVNLAFLSYLVQIG